MLDSESTRYRFFKNIFKLYLFNYIKNILLYESYYTIPSFLKCFLKKCTVILETSTNEWLL